MSRPIVELPHEAPGEEEALAGRVFVCRGCRLPWGLSMAHRRFWSLCSNCGRAKLRAKMAAYRARRAERDVPAVPLLGSADADVVGNEGGRRC